MPNRRKGFTLIELLVVIAIIGILAAMLFPVFARARESARKTQCLSNVKNIAMAYQMYLSDYDRFPPKEHDQNVLAFFNTVPGGGNYNGNTWWSYCEEASFCNPYLRWPVILDEYIKNRDVWRCPSAQHETRAMFINPAPNGNWVGYLEKSVGSWGKPHWPMSPCGAGGSFPSGWGGSVTDTLGQNMVATDDPNTFRQSVGDIGHPCSGLTLGPSNCDMSIASIQDPSWFVVCGDSLWNDIEYPSAMAFPEICGSIGICAGGCNTTEPDFWNDISIRKKYTRHLGGSNLGFADGHAKWFPADQILSESPSYTDPQAGHLRGIGTQLYPWEWNGSC